MSETTAKTPVCRKCGIELTEENQYPSCRKNWNYICKACDKKRSSLWKKAHADKAKVSWTKTNRKAGHELYTENKNCASFLGMHIAERVLSHVFKNVERMPYNNPGYDFICNKGKKIDVKSSCIQKTGVWGFNIRHNSVADFFLCLAFDNREDLNPLHVWLIQGGKLNHLTNATIRQTTIHKWDEYRLDISKISDCCDSLRSTKNETPHNTPSTNDFDWDLTVVDYLKAGLNPAKIADKLGVPKQTLQHHLNKLKKQGIIYKAGYGVWNVLKEPTTENLSVRTLSHVATVKTPQQVRTFAQASLTKFTQDAVRGHAFRTRFQVPRGLRNWNNEKRTQYLTAHSIPYKHLKIGGEGQRIIVKDRKVWLLNKAIIIYDTASYFAEAALEAKQTALATHLGIIKHIERLLHTSFLVGSDYKFKVSSQHYALIYNALAKQYNAAGEKLEVRTAKGTWLIIDDSYGMNELETVHPKTGMTDNDKVKDWFDGLKEIPASQGAPKYTPGFVLGMLAGIQQNQQIITENQLAYATNIESHITSIQDLGTGVRDMNKLLKEVGR